MLKKSLLSLAVAASLGVSGCNISSTSGNNDVTSTQPDTTTDEVVAAAGVFPIFDPAVGAVPLGIDLVFAKAAATDGTADSGTTHPGTKEPTRNASPITNALDDLPGGISTVAPIDFKFQGSILPNTVTAGETVYLVRQPNVDDTSTGGTVTLPEGASAVNPLSLATIAALYPVDEAGNPTATAQANVGATIAMQPSDGDFTAADYEVSVISMDGGTDNVIRVIPTKPLEAQTKYIVVLTKGIQDADGNAIASSPSYSYIKSTPTNELYAASLVGVQASIAGWELLASNIIGNNPNEAANLAPGIALTSAFTTVDPHTVLKSMAYPGYWLPSVISNNTIADAVITAGGMDASQIPDAAKIQTAIAVGNAALTTDTGSGAAYEHPRDRDTAVIENVGGAGVDQLPGVALSSSLPGSVLVSQGAIELPQYTTTLTADSKDQWTANTAIGAVLDAALGRPTGTTPPSDVNGEKNVTYRFPFAAEQRKVVAPMIMIEPTVAAKATALVSVGATDSGCTKPANGWETIIFQHGITVDRGGVLAMGSQLAAATCHAVIAIDLPHHGIAPVAGDRDGADSDNSRLALGVDYTNADDATATPFAAAVDAIVAANSESLLSRLAERHEGLAKTATQAVAPMTFGSVAEATAFGRSGDFFIRLDKFQRTSDNMKQAVMDLLNLNASIAGIDIDGDGSADLDEDNVHFIGHSLGAIIGATFVAVNNDATVQAGNTSLPVIKSAVLATPGGALPKLLENSVSFSGSLLPGLAALSPTLVQGNSNLEKFFGVFQATVDTADPVNFVQSLASGGGSATNTLIIEMVGGGAVSATDASLDKIPTAIEEGGLYPADLVVPNNATNATLANGTAQAESARTPMAGTDKLISLIGATHLASDDTTETHVVTKFTEGTHGTFSSADSIAAFSEMVGQVATFVATDGGTLNVTNTAVLSAP